MGLCFRYDTQNITTIASGFYKSNPIVSTPIILDMRGRAYFVVNRETTPMTREDVELSAMRYMMQNHLKIVNQLEKYGGAFYTIEGEFENPFTMLETVHETDCTLALPKLEVCGGENGYARYYDFTGEVGEVSSKFHYRMYSPCLAARVREITIGMPVFPEDDYTRLAPVLPICPKCSSDLLKIKGVVGMTSWAVICKCGHKGPICENEDDAAFAWIDGETK